MSQNRSALRSYIIQIKTALDALDGKVMSVSYKPVPDFPSKSNYPIDFQIFMEEIGLVNIGSDPQHGAGYTAIDMDLPICLADIEEEDTGILAFDYYGCDSLKGVPADKVVFVASDVHADCYGFDKSTSPFKFFATEDKSSIEHSEFVPWFVWHVNACLSYQANQAFHLPEIP